MKKLLIALMASLCVLSFAACGDNKPAEDTNAPSGTEAPAETPEKEEAPAKKEKTQVIGNDDVGYAAIPENWKDISQDGLLQYADPKLKCVITMNAVSREGMTDEQKAMATMDFFIENVKISLEEGGTTNIEITDSTLNGLPGKKLTGDFNGGKAVCWFVEDGDNIFVPSVEGPTKDIETLVGYVDSSFSATKGE